MDRVFEIGDTVNVYVKTRGIYYSKQKELRNRPYIRNGVIIAKNKTANGYDYLIEYFVLNYLADKFRNGKTCGWYNGDYLKKGSEYE